MSKIINSLSEVNFSVEDAAAGGYRFRVWADGYAGVVKADGTHYTVEGFRCDCPNAVHHDGGSYQFPDGRHICKHVAVVLQARPCEHCGRTMVLLPGSAYFECFECGNARDVRIVRQERREAFEALQRAEEPEPFRSACASHACLCRHGRQADRSAPAEGGPERRTAIEARSQRSPLALDPPEGRSRGSGAVLSPLGALWARALAVMISGEVLEAWVPPVGIAVLQHCHLEVGPYGPEVRAPDGYRAGVVARYEAEIRKALEAARKEMRDGRNQRVQDRQDRWGASHTRRHRHAWTHREADR